MIRLLLLLLFLFSPVLGQELKSDAKNSSPKPLYDAFKLEDTNSRSPLQTIKMGTHIETTALPFKFLIERERTFSTDITRPENFRYQPERLRLRLGLSKHLSLAGKVRAPRYYRPGSISVTLKFSW